MEEENTSKGINNPGIEIPAAEGNGLLNGRKESTQKALVSIPARSVQSTHVGPPLFLMKAITGNLT